MNAFGDTTLAVLAGGAGSRMGRPKSLLILGGVPILEYLHRRLAFPGPTLLVTAPGRERPPGHELYATEVSDPVLDAGPMMGILAAARATTTRYLVVTAVDMPGVTSKGLAHLVAEVRDEKSVAAMFRPGELEPLPLALALPECLSLLEARRNRGPRSLAEEASVSTMPVPGDLPENFWANLNRPEDLAGY